MTPESMEQFANGANGNKPAPQAVEIAKLIADAALDQSEAPEITLDTEECLAFDLRNRQGQLILAELMPEGTLLATWHNQDGAFLEVLMGQDKAEAESESVAAWLNR